MNSGTTGKTGTTGSTDTTDTTDTTSPLASATPPARRSRRPLRRAWLDLLNPLTLFRRRAGMDGTIADQALQGRGIRFVRRIYRMRMIGVAVGLLCVAAGFLQHPVSWPLWLLLLGHALAWPQVARYWALHSAIPYRAERRNLVIDSMFGGFWVAALHGNLVPSAVIIAMLCMDNIAAGGARLFMRGLYAGLATCAFGWWLLDGGFLPQSSIVTTLASLPMLVLYPLALGKTTYDMSRKIAERSRAFEQVSQTDGLTGLYNRRHWESLLIAQFERCRGAAAPAGEQHTASLLLLDLDHFKAINDTHGHLAGDEVLRQFAGLLRSNLRQQDAIGRYGGEEFGVVLSSTSAADALMLAQRLIDAVRHQKAGSDCLMGCTVSAGLVSFTPDMTAHYTWLQRADHAMYRAKQQGRDCLVPWQDEPAQLSA